MFFLCVNIIKIKNINNTIILFSSKAIFKFNPSITVSFTTATISTVKEENIDDTDEYLNIKKTINQVKINKKLSCIDKANNTPKYVATPFPPLNFNQIGKICPKKTNIQLNLINSG